MKGRVIMIPIIIVIVLLLVGGCFLILKKPMKNINIIDIQSFHFGYSTGNMMNSNVSFSVTCKEKCMASIKPNNESPDDEYEVEVDSEFIHQLKEILIKYQVSKWDGYQKSNSNVMDGDSFSIYVEVDKEHSISASGYMMYPKNYREVENEITELFMNLYDNRNQNTIKVLLDDEEYIMYLEDNDTVEDFLKLIPKTFSMKELNKNEKYVSLKKKLSNNSSVPNEIHRGDVYLFGDDCLVVFYKSFSTEYSYTKIGHINNFPSLNQDDIVITFQ